jgi:hypothetical protein
MFAVCFPTTYGKGKVFVVRLVLAHGKGNEQANSCKGVTSGGEKNVCRAPREKCMTNYFFDERFFYHVPWKSCMAKHLFAVRPRKCARQSFGRAAKREFPVVIALIY